MKDGISVIVDGDVLTPWRIKLKLGKMQFVEKGIKNLVKNDLLLLTGPYTLCFMKVDNIADKTSRQLAITGSPVVNKEQYLAILQRQLRDVHMSPTWKDHSLNADLILQTFLTKDVNDKYIKFSGISKRNGNIQDIIYTKRKKEKQK